MKPTQWRSKCHFRGPKGFGAYLILLVTCLFFSYQNGLNKVFELAQPTLSKLDKWQNMVVVTIITEACSNLLFPFAGWLADGKFGRRNMLSVGMLMTWVSAVILLFISVLHDNYRSFNNSTFIVMVIVNYTIYAIGTAFFHANLVPFGIDQMEDCSSDQMSSFIHWYYLTKNVNLGVILQQIYSVIPSTCDDGKYENWISMIQIVLLTIGLCLLFICSKDLKTDPLVYNPIRVVHLVTKYILKHSKPVRYRSARTYLSEVQPVRSDFAKRSYGGVFEDDIVEEVVTFWRFMVFLIPIGIFCVIFYMASCTTTLILEHMASSQGSSSCVTEYSITSITPNLTYLVCILAYEFVLCPFFHKYIPPLKVKIGLGMLLLLAAIGYILAVDASAHYNFNMYHNKTEYNGNSYQLCFLLNHSDIHGGPAHLTFSTYILVPFIVMCTISELLIFLTILEFICAQAPRSMLSFLISSSYFVYGVSALIMTIFVLPFGFGFKATLKHLTYSCGSVFFASVICFGIVGFILYFYIAKWYKNRQRGGQNNINYQFVIEGYYEKMIEERDRQDRLKLLNSPTSYFTL